MMIEPLLSPRHTPARCVILMSGSGSNADALLKYAARYPLSYLPTAIFTDSPETSRAAEIAGKYSKVLVSSDIRKFYAAHGEDSIKLDTPHRRELRDLWSDEIQKMLTPFEPDFLLFAGFIPLTNLTGAMPCLNVHPGDLTVTGENGERLLAGLHYLPVERAILAGYPALRSSVILARPYSGDGASEMDSGHIIGLSAPVPIDLDGESPATLQNINAMRQSPPYRDRLRQVAEINVEKLKLHGDHQVFPRAAADFAAGNFGSDRESGELFFHNAPGDRWQKITTVCYRTDGEKELITG